MKEQLISFETALLAEKKGFDKRVTKIAMKNHTTQSLLQKWLREKHDIQIIIGSDYKCYDFGITLEKGFNGITHKNCRYATYELALEACLFKALNMIKP